MPIYHAFSPALAFGRPALFTTERVKPDAVAPGFFLAQCGFGSILTAERLPISAVDIQPQDLELCAGDCHTLEKYVQGGFRINGVKV